MTPSCRFSKNTVCFFYLVKRKTVGNEWCRINLAFGYQAKNLCTVASVYTTGLESAGSFRTYRAMEVAGGDHKVPRW